MTGSRDWTNWKVMGDALTAQIREHGPCMFVHGANPRGADAFVDSLCRGLSHATVERHPADWKLGKIAGHLRNQQMVDLGADACLAFPMPGSRGTWDCVRRAEAAGIPVKVFAQEQLPVREVRQGFQSDLVVFDEYHELVQGELF